LESLFLCERSTETSTRSVESLTPKSQRLCGENFLPRQVTSDS
jgi:hypothetical protein